MDKKDPSYIPSWDDYLKQVDDFTRKMIESLKQGMQPPAPETGSMVNHPSGEIIFLRNPFLLLPFNFTF